MAAVLPTVDDTPPPLQPPPPPILPPVEIQALPIWLAWLSDNDVPHGKRPRKKFISIPGGKPTSVANITAADHATAYRFAITPGVAGRALVLGPVLGKDLAIIGVDLDDCRNPVTGEIAPWAQVVIDAFSSYTEVSPSRCGAKIYALVTLAGLSAIEATISMAKGGNGSSHSLAWKWRSRAEHGPAIEVYTSKRWFAFTGRHLLGTPTEFRRIDAATIIDLIDRVGPAFLASDPAARSLKAPSQALAAANDLIIAPALPQSDFRARIRAAAEHNPELRRLSRGDFGHLRDQSRSGVAMGLGGALKRAGFDYADMKQGLQEFPATEAWAAEQEERAFQRIWQNAGEEKKVDPAEVFDSIKPLPGANAAPASTSEPVRSQRRAMTIIPRRDLKKLPQATWRYDRHIPRSGIVFLAGDPKTYKTFGAMALAVSLAAGTPWAGIPAATGPSRVGFWAGEGLAEAHPRISALEGHLGLAEVESLDIVVGPFVAGEIIEAYRETGLDALFIDSWSKALGSAGLDENSSKDMAAAIAQLDRIRDELGSLIVVLHHLGKDSAKGMRGSTVMLAAADAVYIASVKPTGQVVWVCAAMRASEAPPPLVFELQKFGDSAVLVKSDRATQVGPGGEVSIPLTANEKQALEALKIAIYPSQEPLTGLVEHAPVKDRSRTLPAGVMRGLGTTAVRVEEWREAFHARRAGLTRDVNARALMRAKEKLADRGLITVSDGWVRLTLASATHWAQGRADAAGEDGE
jgi:hypothetical protein